MIEAMIGVWLVVLSAGAGFLYGRYGTKPSKRVKPVKETNTTFGWQELLNFLQYDGSGLPLADGTERKGGNDRK